MEWYCIMDNLQLRELTEKEKKILREGLKDIDSEKTQEFLDDVSNNTPNSEQFNESGE